MSNNEEEYEGDLESIQTYLTEKIPLIREPVQTVLKSTMLMNGGAAIALLAFTRESASGILTEGFAGGIIFFAIGVAFSGYGTLVGTIENYLMFRAFDKSYVIGKNTDELKIKVFFGQYYAPSKLLQFYQINTMVTAGISFVSFLVGLALSIRPFINM